MEKSGWALVFDSAHFRCAAACQDEVLIFVSRAQEKPTGALPPPGFLMAVLSPRLHLSTWPPPGPGEFRAALLLPRGVFRALPQTRGSAALTAPFLACLNEHGFHGSWKCCCSLSLCIILNKGNPKVAAMVLCSWGRSECVRARTVSHREGSQPLNGASYAVRFLKISLGRVLLHLSFRGQPHLSGSLGCFQGPAGRRARAHELMLERCILPTSKKCLVS